MQLTHVYPDGSRLAVCGDARPADSATQGFRPFDAFTVEDLAKPAASSVVDQDEGESVYFSVDKRRGIVRRNTVGYCDGSPQWLFEWTYTCTNHRCSLSERTCVSENSRGRLDPRVVNRVNEFLGEPKITRSYEELKKHPACDRAKLMCQAYAGDTDALDLVVGEPRKSKCRFENGSGESIEADQQKLRDLKEAGCGLR